MLLSPPQNHPFWQLEPCSKATPLLLGRQTNHSASHTACECVAPCRRAAAAPLTPLSALSVVGIGGQSRRFVDAAAAAGGD